MILTHAEASRLQTTAMRFPLREANGRIPAFTPRDRRSGFALLLSANY